MKPLNEMSLVGLADFYSYCDANFNDTGREECAKEIRRRQAMLDAAEGMAKALKLCEWSAGHDDCSFGFCPACGVPEFRPHRETCDIAVSLAAYTAAKGDR